MAAIPDLSEPRAPAAVTPASEAHFRLLADHINDLIMLVDSEFRRLYVTPSVTALLGYDLESFFALTAKDIIHPDDLDHVLTAYQQARQFELIPPTRYRYRHQQGHYIWVEGVGRRVADGDGYVITIRDITHRLEIEQRLQAANQLLAASEQRFRLLSENAEDVVMLVNPEMRRIYVSPSVTTLLGYSPDEYAAMSLPQVIHPDDLPTVLGAYRNMRETGSAGVIARYRYRHKDGHHVWVEGNGRLAKDGSGYVITIRDMTHRLDIERQLEDANRRLELLAARDGLTGLANRRCLDESLTMEFRRAARTMMPLSLVMVDVDHFKTFNDAYGHQQGDGCLRLVADALRRCVYRAADLVARYGGEELAILLPTTEAEGAFVVAERMRLAVRSEELRHSGNPAGVLTISVGVATIYPCAGSGGESALIAAADQALYRAKEEGRDRVCAAAPVFALLARDVEAGLAV